MVRCPKLDPPGHRENSSSNGANSVMARFRRRPKQLSIPGPTGPPIDERLLLDRVPRAGSPGLLFVCGEVFAFFGLFLIIRLLTQPVLDSIFLCIVFPIMCFALLKALLQTIFAGERLWLDSGGLEYGWSFGLARGRRLVPLEEIQRVSMYEKSVDDLGVAGAHTEYGLEIETLGQPLRVGQSRQSDDVAELESRFKKRMREIAPGWLSLAPTDDREILERSSTLAKPPSDSTIVCRREWDHTEFVRRWREPAQANCFRPRRFDRHCDDLVPGGADHGRRRFVPVFSPGSLRVSLRAHGLELRRDDSRPPEVECSPR